MVNRWAPSREPLARQFEEAVIDGDAGGAVLAGAAALGRRPAGPAGGARPGAATPAPAAAAGALQAGPLGPRRARGRPRSRALRGNGERLRLRATDQPEGWTVTLGPERFDWVGGGPDRGPGGAATRAVTVRATAAELYLLLWRRRPPTDGRFEVGGDRALLAHWLQHSVVS
jgi:hypothetical protein